MPKINRRLGEERVKKTTTTTTTTTKTCKVDPKIPIKNLVLETTCTILPSNYLVVM